MPRWSVYTPRSGRACSQCKPPSPALPPPPRTAISAGGRDAITCGWWRRSRIRTIRHQAPAKLSPLLPELLVISSLIRFCKGKEKPVQGKNVSPGTRGFAQGPFPTIWPVPAASSQPRDARSTQSQQAEPCRKGAGPGAAAPRMEGKGAWTPAPGPCSPLLPTRPRGCNKSRRRQGHHSLLLLIKPSGARLLGVSMDEESKGCFWHRHHQRLLCCSTRREKKRSKKDRARNEPGPRITADRRKGLSRSRGSVLEGRRAEQQPRHLGCLLGHQAESRRLGSRGRCSRAKPAHVKG